MSSNEARHTAPPGRSKAPESLLGFAQNQANAALKLQSEFLGEVEDTGRTWLARARREAELWSALAAKLAVSRTIPEAFDAYRDCFAQRMQMTAEDARTVFDEYQQFASTMVKPFSHAPRHNEPANNERENTERSAPWPTRQKMTA